VGAFIIWGRRGVVLYFMRLYYFHFLCLLLQGAFFKLIINKLLLAFKANRIFYIGAITFIFIAAGFVFMGNHGDAIIWFSERRTSFLNSFFEIITRVGEAWSYVLLLCCLLCYKYRYALMVFLLAILVPLVSLTLKTLFSQPRPKKFFMDNEIFENLNVIEGIALHTANTSFPSGHTISAFAVMGFAAFTFSKFKWTSFIFIGLAIAVALSRVYLVQHFLLDVCVGAGLGCMIAWCASWASIQVQDPEKIWLESNLLTMKKSKIRT